MCTLKLTVYPVVTRWRITRPANTKGRNYFASSHEPAKYSDSNLHMLRI